MAVKGMYISYVHGKGSISTTFENCNDRISTLKMLHRRNIGLINLNSRSFVVLPISTIEYLHLHRLNIHLQIPGNFTNDKVKLDCTDMFITIFHFSSRLFLSDY